MDDLRAEQFDDLGFLANLIVDMAMAGFLIRTMMWLAWESPRSERFLRFCRFPREQVLSGPFSRMLQWWFHIDPTGKDRDA